MLFLAFTGAGGGYAIASQEVVFVLSDPKGPYLAFADAVIRKLAQRPAAGISTKVVTPADWAARRAVERSWESVRLIVPVGVRAARVVSEQTVPAPVLFAMIPDVLYPQLAGVSEARSAIFINQPVERHVALVRTALPGVRRIGAVLGPTSALMRPALERAVARYGLELLVETIEDPGEAVDATQRLSRRVDVLLGMADPAVFNPNTIQGVLLTTYMNRVPLIGYSGAYVDAGALMAVFSTPDQIGRQLAEILRVLEAGGWSPPSEPFYPAYYHVAVNRSVARSLNLDIPDASLLEQWLGAEGERP